MNIIFGHDAIHDNVARLPKGQTAGYTTGSADIRWTSHDWSLHPEAVRIDQDFAASDPSADVLDVERGAATLADCAPWAKKAMADFKAAVRPGQRKPAIYFSLSAIHDVANALVNGGVNSGVGFFVADWGMSSGAASRMIAGSGGPFPIVAVQYSNGAFYDYDAFSQDWLDNVSGVMNPVRGLKVTRRGFTNMDLEWDAPAGATGYTIHAYRGAKLRHTVDTTVPRVRVHFLAPRTKYHFVVRAHPGHSVGQNATIVATTR